MYLLEHIRNTFGTSGSLTGCSQSSGRICDIRDQVIASPLSSNGARVMKGQDMTEKIVVVVGSTVSAGEYEPNYFWVIDFSNASAATPGVVQVQLPFSGSGCVVDCAGTMAAVGSSTKPSGYGSSVTIYDISTPATPKSIGSASLSFNGVGAIAFYGGYVLAGEAGGRRVALIEIGNLGSPVVYETGLDTLTDVSVFGEYAVVCGTSVYHNAFQVASIISNNNNNNLSSLQNAGATFFSNAAGYPGAPAVTCDFDGTRAVFSDGSGVYIFGVSNGIPTANPVAPSGPGLEIVTSVTIAESQNAEGEPSGGVMTAYAASSTYFDLNFCIPVTLEANPVTISPGLGEPKRAGDQVADYAGVVKFSRNIYGTSGLLAAAGVTENTANVQEYVVTLYKVNTVPSGGPGSITATREGQRATVQLPTPPDTMLATLGITTFDTFPVPPFPLPRPIGIPIEQF